MFYCNDTQLIYKGYLLIFDYRKVVYMSYVDYSQCDLLS
jgi:hypothetical protein